MMIAAPTLPLVDLDPDPTVRWFSAHGCVLYRDDVVEVYVGGSLIGSFAPRETATRNALVVGLAEDPKAHFGRLAKAFGLTSEGLRLMRRQYEAEGLAAVIARKRGGGVTKLTPTVRRRLERLFEKGVSVKSIVAQERRVRRGTIYRARAEWEAARRPKQEEAERAAPQVVLPDAEPSASTEPAFSVETNAAATATAPTEVAAARHDDGSGSLEEDGVADARIDATAPLSGGWVQHLGTWLMIAMVAKLGLHRTADKHRRADLDHAALRIALDAVIGALSIGERCVEGVRRLATATGRLMLRATRAPSATWVRRVLGRFARERGYWLHLDMGASYLQGARDDEQAPAVFYVDNHLRPYTGQAVVRRGWRMQDKRVVPGATDYYVHDEDGRPVLRIDAPDNGALTAFLTPIAKLLRLALGPAQKIMLAFDRAGAYPEQLAELRDLGFDLVTYERRPFPLLPEPAFTGSAELDGEKVAIHDARINLGSGRGRLRRIAIRFADGRQMNLVAVSSEPPQRLIDVMRGRWSQENAFKHGAERWGINQLDGRSTVPYPPETVIPNPARRRLDRALRVAKVREGEARRELARLPAEHPRRARLERELDESLRQQEELEALRPTTPKRAPLQETELAGKLVHHTAEYKLTIDAVRIACANSECDLASELAPHLHKPAEAKRVLRNLFAAPGRVHVGSRAITITLQPAANRNEAEALDALLAIVNRWRLTLPGDPDGRPMRFRLHQES
jgi:hypothetical protein